VTDVAVDPLTVTFTAIEMGGPEAPAAIAALVV
jgi:hypothetical protein